MFRQRDNFRFLGLGFKYVAVNGELVVDSGMITDARPGLD